MKVFLYPVEDKHLGVILTFTNWYANWCSLPYIRDTISSFDVLWRTFITRDICNWLEFIEFFHIIGFSESVGKNDGGWFHIVIIWPLTTHAELQWNTWRSWSAQRCKVWSHMKTGPLALWTIFKYLFIYFKKYSDELPGSLRWLVISMLSIVFHSRQL